MPRIAMLHRLVLPAVLLSAIALALLTGWFAQRQGEAARDAWDERLDAAADGAAALLLNSWPRELDAASQDLAVTIDKFADLRATLVDSAGRVVGESQLRSLESVRKLENHRNRVELVEARRSGAAFATRVSSTFGQRFRYRAVRINRGKEIVGFVRLAALAEHIDDDADQRRLAAWKLGGIATAAFSAGLLLILARTTRPLRDLAQSARAMAGGDYDQRIVVSNRVNDDLASLSQSLAEIGKRLAKREYQLHRNWQTQATVLEGMAEGVVAVDANERILFANRSAGTALGFNAQAVEGRTLLEAVRSHELREACQHAMRTGEFQERELVWRAGKPRTFEAGASPLPGDPCPGAVLVIRDISELKRLEGLRQQFIANVSHELKTPLSSIKAYAETLLGGALHDPDNAERFLRRIDEQSDRLNQLVRDMLSLARIESGQTTLELTTVSVAKVAERCVLDYETQAKSKSVALVNDAGDRELNVRADEEALWQILSNLVDNAVKYSPEGGRVGIAARREGEMAVIEVSDTGPGIPPEHHARVFERFYRVDKARSRELGGTGLGLAIVKHLSQIMGGSVAVTSVPGKGALFSVKLPLVDG
ncbi:MAG: PAS domain-containing protein [Pirellulales bacterium]|nr:PAS domain-containing protein [Pirellulales bacterium]